MAGDTTLLKAQKAVFDLLTGDVTLAALAGIYDEPKQGVSFPYITLGEGDESPSDTFGKQGKNNRLTIHIWSRHNGMKEVGEIAERMNFLMDSASLSIAGYNTIHVTHMSTRFFRDPDGETRHGVCEYDMIFMEP